MTKELELTGSINLTFDEDSVEFKDSFEAYKKSIDPSADIDDMLMHVAFYINRFGNDGMVEGVGYVAMNGREHKKPFSGIFIDRQEIDFDIEIK